MWRSAFLCEAQVESWRSQTEKAEFIHRAVKEITDVMVYDIYSPPVASRTYAYITVAGYEACSSMDANNTSALPGSCMDYRALPQPDKSKTIQLYACGGARHSEHRVKPL